MYFISLSDNTWHCKGTYLEENKFDQIVCLDHEIYLILKVFTQTLSGDQDI